MERGKLQASFTLDNYRGLFAGQGGDLSLTLKTVVTAMVVVALVIILAYPVAYFLALRLRSLRLGATALVLIALPFLVGPLIRVIAWRGVLGLNGVVNGVLERLGLVEQPVEWLLFSRFSLVVALVYNSYPFMLFALVLSLNTLERNTIAAARDLGASATKTVRSVVFPLSLPGLLVGSILTFVAAASATVEPQELGGPNGRLIANSIADKFFLAVNWPAGAAITVFFTILAGTALILIGGVLTVLTGRVRVFHVR
jgi:ABC-type spermidine/putrescine transport system permease subunit I